ncbi:MAG: phenylalanine--tRNA ligase beta subunit-related protein [Bacteroidales bacterium]|nr:phenylalanine--tRNA ligase beta subunit-related protein [Bacteroidales bacterium]
MVSIVVSDEIREACPGFVGAAVFAAIKNTEFNEELWRCIDVFAEGYRGAHVMEDIKKNPAVAATREAYKRLGKDPNRYRPSSESLCRRLVKGLSLYRVNTVVDLINLVSAKTGYSIGGFDAGKISGDTLTLGVGRPEEPYEGIGRGVLNIECLPVYRDASGGIGTPTSDHERTKLGLDSSHLLAIINGYSGRDGLDDAVTLLVSLLREFAGTEHAEVCYF